jgi:hypothetical protein
MAKGPPGGCRPDFPKRKGGLGKDIYFGRVPLGAKNRGVGVYPSLPSLEESVGYRGIFFFSLPSGLGPR